MKKKNNNNLSSKRGKCYQVNFGVSGKLIDPNKRHNELTHVLFQPGEALYR